MGLFSGCVYSSIDASLPESSEVVNHKNPLTSDDAASVTESGNDLIDSMVEPLLASGYVPHPVDTPSESWSACQAAQQKFFGDGQLNGVRYVARVRLEAPEDDPLQGVIETVSAHADISWNQDSPSTLTRLGESGLFRLSVDQDTQGSRDIAIGVSSPCYFLRKVQDGEGGAVNLDDVAQVTGFTTRDLALPQ